MNLVQKIGQTREMHIPHVSPDFLYMVLGVGCASASRK
jgi:hypothetical protein